MICPTCNEQDIGEPPWESWYRCANCDIHPDTSLYMKTQRERIASLEVKLDAMEQERRETWGMCALISLFEEIERYFGRFPVGTEEQGHDATVGSLLHQLRRLRLVATRTIAAQQEKEE